MDKNTIYLLINVNYANTKFKMKKEDLITYNELREEAIKYFNIDIKKGDNIEFIYTDEDQEKNILQHDEEDIFSAANFINNNYLLNLDLIVINNQKPNIENKINKNENLVKNTKVCLNNEEKKEEINNNVFGNKLKQFGFLFQKQFYSMKNDISKMINKKYKEIENQLIKLNVEVNNKNKNEFIEKKRIKRSNNHYMQNQNQKKNKSNKSNENKTKNVKIIDGDEEIIIKQDNKNEDYMLIEKSTIFSPKKIIKEDDDFEFINNFVDSDELDEGEENILDKDDNIHGSNLFSSNNIQKNDQKFGKIMKNINNLYKNKNYSYNDIITNGNNIFEIMNTDKGIHKIGVIDINKHIKHYLIKGHKKGLPLNEKIKYCKILKYLNHFLEIKKVQAILDINLKEEIEIELEIEKEKSKDKNKQTAEENIKDENKLITFIDSFNKNNNKEYVQQKLEILIKSLHIKL